MARVENSPTDHGCAILEIIAATVDPPCYPLTMAVVPWKLASPSQARLTMLPSGARGYSLLSENNARHAYFNLRLGRRGVCN